MTPTIPTSTQAASVLLVGQAGTAGVDDALRARGLTPERVALGIEALERLFEPGRALPRVAVVGLLSPDFDGLTLLRALRAAPGTNRLPLIVLVDPLSEPVARTAGATVCLPRRATDDQIVDAVGRCAELEAETTAPAPSVRMASRRVLVVDDEPVNRAAATDMLRRLAVESDAAADGREALERLDATAYALVLLDLHMPGMDGFTVAQRLRAGGSASAAAHVFALTADTRAGVAEQCIVAGMDGFLPKPITFGMLREALTTAGIHTQAPASVTSDVDLTALFYASASEHVATLEATLRDGQRRRFRQTAHALKGSALQFGAQDVAAIAARLEAEAELEARQLTDSVASIRMLLAAAGGARTHA